MQECKTQEYLFFPLQTTQEKENFENWYWDKKWMGKFSQEETSGKGEGWKT